MNRIDQSAHATGPDPRLGRRVVTNTLVQFAPAALRIILGIVLVAALSRYLGVAGLGEYALVFTYVAIFNIVFNDWGLGTIVVRELSQRPGDRPALLASAATLQVVISFAAYGVLLMTLTMLPYSQALKNATMLYGLTLLLGPAHVLALLFEADLRLVKLLVPSALQVVLNFILSIGVVLLGGSLLALAGASLVALTVRSVWTGYLGWREAGLKLTTFTRTLWRGWWALLREAWPIGAASTFKMVWQQGPVLILGMFSLSATGLFNAANRVPQQLILVPLAMNTSMFPLLARSWVTDRARFARQLDRLVGGSLFAVVPAVIFGVALAQPFVRLIFGTEFAGAGVAFALLLVTTGLMFPIVFLAEALNAAGHQRLNLLITVALSPVVMALLFLLVPQGGASGAALALMLGYATFMAALLAGARWRLGEAAPVRALGVASLAAAFGGGALILSSPLGPVGAGTVGAAVAIVAFGLARPSIVSEYLGTFAEWRQPVISGNPPAPAVVRPSE